MKKLGVGLMRLPLADPDDWRKVDMEASKVMINRYLAEGFRYLDTAYVYHGDTSERLFGELIAKRYPREAYTLTTKMPVFNEDYVKSPEDYEKIFAERMERCQVEYFDYYLLHGIGKIRYIAFSYHDDAATLNEILTDYPETEMVQLQLNYIDWDDESVQPRRCYEVCVKHGVQVVVMEPMEGGALVNLPDSAADILKEADPDASLASWGIRFAASPDNVMMVLSGMSSLEQLEDNMRTMQDFQPLTMKESETVSRTVKLIRDSIAIPCTACRYCVDGCPQWIAIPEYFALYNKQKQFGLLPELASNYLNLTVKFGKPDACTDFSHCETHCPQHLPIREKSYHRRLPVKRNECG